MQKITSRKQTYDRSRVKPGMTIRILRTFLIFLPVLLMLVSIGALSQANADVFTVPQGLCGIGGFPCPEGETGTEIAKNLAGRIVDNVRFIIGAIAVLMIIISGIKLLTAGGNEEVFTKQSTALVFAVIGLFLVGLSGEIASILEVDRGGFLKDPNVAVQKSRLFNRTIEIIITFIKYIIGSVAVLFIVRNGLRLVLLGGNEEEVTKDKKNIFYGLLGLVVILMSNPIINKVFFKIDTSQYPGIDPVRPSIDRVRLAQEIAGATNIVAAIAGPFALLSLVAGGLMYILAGGEEEKIGKAKKIIMWSAIGLIIIYGAFAIVSTFVARQFEGL